MTGKIIHNAPDVAEGDIILETRRRGEYGHFVMPLLKMLQEAASFFGIETDVSEIHKEISAISRASQGVHPEEAAVLYGVTRLAQPEFVLETGTFEGYSTTEIAKAICKNGYGRFETVDIAKHTGSRVPDELRSFVTFRRGMASLELANYFLKQSISIDLFFHDSLHTYCNALEELISFAPFFSPGAFIVCHDAKMDFMPEFGVGRAVRDFAQLLELNFIILDTTCGLALIHWPSQENREKLKNGLEKLQQKLRRAKADTLLVNRVQRVRRIFRKE